MGMSTYQQLLKTARERLIQQGIADANVDAWYLLAHIFGMNRVDFLLKGTLEAPLDQTNLFMELLERRTQHIPLQYLIGNTEFMGLEFDVTEDVLIPRQDTEILVSEVLKETEGKRILDMCTGSGCIIISLAKLGKPSKAAAVDISLPALTVANKNANKHQVEIELIHSNLFDQVKESYDIIVSNPPYIPSKEIARLMPEVKDHEPFIALDGMEDGLFFYRNIIASLDKHLNKDGTVYFEIGHDQGEAVKQILQENGFAYVNIVKDLSGLDRVVIAKRV